MPQDQTQTPSTPPAKHVDDDTIVATINAETAEIKAHTAQNERRIAIEDHVQACIKRMIVTIDRLGHDQDGIAYVKMAGHKLLIDPHKANPDIDLPCPADQIEDKLLKAGHILSENTTKPKPLAQNSNDPHHGLALAKPVARTHRHVAA